MRVLFVCTANICRSASAEALVRDAVAADPALAGVEVRSAGTHALAGMPACRVAPALAGRWEGHASQPLTPELVAWADLVLTAAREHRSAVVAIDHRARSRVFTLRQAGRIADWLVDRGAPVQLETVVTELDDARGLVPVPVEVEVAPVLGEARGSGRRRWRSWIGARQHADGEAADDLHPDDIPDPHVLGTGWHAESGRQIEAAVGSVLVLLGRAAT
jgi:protein-tyrosine phosphatase